MAASVVFTIPTVALYFLVQQFFVRGMGAEMSLNMVQQTVKVS